MKVMELRRKLKHYFGFHRKAGVIKCKLLIFFFVVVFGHQIGWGLINLNSRYISKTLVLNYSVFLKCFLCVK